ncbi:MAG TPA: DUF2914 domain-containing protein [Polyangiaceae bacterium]|nr:DUF2914 domain-containing protein [Polyangiaceae bacterium]
MRRLIHIVPSSLCLALLVGPLLGGCARQDDHVAGSRTTSTEKAPLAAQTAAQTAEQPAAPQPPVLTAQIAPAATGSTEQVTAPAKVLTPKSRPAADAELARFLVTRDVAKREPVGEGPLCMHEPLFAFLEFKNVGPDELDVMVTFEHESGKRVGFIELGVPAGSPRYRTWGRTNQIDRSGRWTAIVQGDDGRELQRHEFVVETEGC